MEVIFVQGVYKIENVNNGKKYIGSSKDIEKRFYQHKRSLENKTHHSVKLQRAWNVSKNKDIFLFDVVELVDDIDTLKDREQYYVDLYDAYHSGYNCSLLVSNPHYTKKNLDKKKGVLMTPKLQDKFNVLYNPDKFYLRGWSVRKFTEGLYSYSSYNLILTCMKWFLSTYPEPGYKLQVGTHSNKSYLWVHYENIDFAVYKYDKGRVVLVKDGTDEVIARLRRMNLYDESHHQVRGGFN